MDTRPEQAATAAAKILGKLGAAKGGKARAAALTQAERSASAREAVLTRWERVKGQSEAGKIPKATHGSADHPLRIGPIEIPCYVLENRQRVISQNGMLSALDMRPSSTKGRSIGQLARFTSGKGIHPFISLELEALASSPIRFRSPTGLAYGYEATVLADICKAVLEARKAGALSKNQLHIAERAEILLSGFAHVGIIALVDEATGYQEDRELRELHAILEKYIAKELMPWTRRFPYEFYEHVFRLRGWRFNALNRMQGPRAIAQVTTKLIYDQLPTGVLDELYAKNPTHNGRRHFKLHQFLTDDIGNKHLEKHLASVTTLLRISETYDEFLSLFHRAFPQPVILDIESREEGL